MSISFYTKNNTDIEEKTLLDIYHNFDTKGSVISKGRNTLKHIAPYAVKRFKKANLVNRYVYAFLRPSKAQRSFEHAIFLQSKGVKTPTPIAYIEHSSYKGLTDSYYIAENLEYDFVFKDVIFKEGLLSKKEWINLLVKFSHFLIHLHNNSIVFKDLSTTNILIKKENEEYNFYLVDLNRMTFKALSEKERLKNLRKLSLTPEMATIIGEEFAQSYSMSKDEIVDHINKYTQKRHKQWERKRLMKKILLRR